ncbi:FAD-dependent oxidoreductase [Streptomyces chrestomyceticus]|uniref:FAD-dependent oxidoreductase n=1 Tax=Streptomyces chrestomyceticus TaxID=68185 RepID=UPI0033FD51E0
MNAGTQVVVIGAGPCGLATAAELLRRGIRVRIFESSSAPSQGSRAIMLWPPAQAVLDDLEVLASARSRAHRPDCLDYFGDRGRLVRVRLNASQSPLVLPQSRTDALLEEAVHRVGGTVERGQRLVDVAQTDDAVEAVIRDGTGRHERQCAQWLIGADGVHSTVRELLGIAFAGSALPTRFALAEGELTGAQAPTSPSYYLTSRGGLVIAPLPNGCVRVAGSIHDGRQASEQLVQNMLDTRGPGGLRMDRFQALTTFSSAERVVERMRAGRVLLVGDAAHTHSAIGGQGLNLGLQDVRNLSWKLAGVITGRLDDAILDTYGPERIAAARQVIKTTGAVTRVALASPPWSALRNAALKVAERTSRAPNWYAARVAGQRIRHPTTSLGRPPGFRGTGLPAPEWAAPLSHHMPDRLLLVTSGPPNGPLPRAADAMAQRHTSLISHHHVPRQRPEFLLIRPDGYVAARGGFKSLPRTERLLVAISPATTSRKDSHDATADI